MTELKVKLLEHTPNPERLIAQAAKLCYSNSSIEEIGEKLTDENTSKFLNMLMSLGHESPIEHINFTFGVEGVSRATSHQLVRHRLASFSQQSQRYVKLDQFEYIIPKEIEKYKYLKQQYIEDMQRVQKQYDFYSEELLLNYIYEFLVEEKGLYSPDIQQDKNLMLNIMKTNHKADYSRFEKKAIENARYVFPNACETKIIFTMNARTLLNFLSHRCCERSQDEIKEMAYKMLIEVKKVAPILFKKAGASCVSLQYCKEGKMSCGRYPTLEQLKKGVKDGEK
jgi:thymidylate synthase (FAD)